jgi:hypothetical protein
MSRNTAIVTHGNINGDSLASANDTVVHSIKNDARTSRTYINIGSVQVVSGMDPVSWL